MKIKIGQVYKEKQHETLAMVVAVQNESIMLALAISYRQKRLKTAMSLSGMPNNGAPDYFLQQP